MSRIINKKRALLTAALASLALVAVAIAWYSTTGSGSNQSAGSTQNGYTNGLVITSSGNASALVPGGSITISGLITNNNSGSAKHGTPVPTIDAGPNCPAANFEFANDLTYAPDTTNVIAANGSRSFTITLNMKDRPDTDQDGCKAAPLEIDWTS